LLYALFLEPDLAHKLGWGKPMGFGSVRLEPLTIQTIDLKSRYGKRSSDSVKNYEGESAGDHVKELTRRFSGDKGEVLQAVRRIFAWPAPDEKWAYPTYDWFKKNPEEPLESFNKGRD
jgi:hypothetical protein